MISLDEWRNRNPRRSGTNHHHYEVDTFNEWRENTLEEARRKINEPDSLGEALDCILSVLEETPKVRY